MEGQIFSPRPRHRPPSVNRHPARNGGWRRLGTRF